MERTEYEGFFVEKEGAIATLVLNRPERLNALLPTLVLSFPRAIEDVRKDDAIRVLIMTGAGRAFCAGGDVGTKGKDKTYQELSQRWSRFLIGPVAISLRNFEKPTIAAINGAAVGAGVSLFLACDITIASENAKFGLAFVKVGLVPDAGATYFLPRKVGISKAIELMCTGDIINAEEAEQIGLVSRVVPQDKLMEEVRELAEKLAKGPPIAIGLIKRAAYKSLDNNLEQQIDFEDYAQSLCFKTEDHKEGARSFMEKREAVFKGT
jgi:2-(1,2-epoxy-1,2-dihydrophenyl)acetyl-CoA isomerase